MKFTAAALITALSLGTGLASVISVPLYARELPSSTSLLQRRSPLEDMGSYSLPYIRRTYLARTDVDSLQTRLTLCV